MPDGAGRSASIHATCVVLGEAGILIRGPSGSGKSRLARDILTEAARHGCFARLVADDRVRIEARHGRIVARAVTATAGLLEARGLGIVRLPHEQAALVRLVVDCSAVEADRLPEGTECNAVISGVATPRIKVRVDGRAAATVLWQLGVLGDTGVTE
jgi:HPr kinase/phosphorylase